MGQNREQLNKLLEFIDDITKNPDNEWFAYELGVRYGKICHPDKNFLQEKMDEIYEHCIERISKEQSAQFYQKFPIKEIVPQLVLDFGRMEHFKRQNAFLDFCMAAFQQVEMITNWFCMRPELDEWVNTVMMQPAYYFIKKELKDGKYVVVDEKRNGSFLICQLLFGKEYEKNKREHIADYAIFTKVVTVLYFICFGAKLHDGNKESFNELRVVLSDLYQCRNQNHRGGTQTDYQKQATEKIGQDKCWYYYKFSSALTCFVELVTKNCVGLKTWKEQEAKIDLTPRFFETKHVQLAQPKVLGKIDLSKIK